jgi:hypothetical protein
MVNTAINKINILHSHMYDDTTATSDAMQVTFKYFYEYCTPFSLLLHTLSYLLAYGYSCHTFISPTVPTSISFVALVVQDLSYIRS